MPTRAGKVGSMDTAPNSLRALRLAEAADTLAAVDVTVLRAARVAAKTRARNARGIYGRKSPQAVAAEAGLERIVAELDVRAALAEAQRVHPLDLAARCEYLTARRDRSMTDSSRETWQRALNLTRNGTP